MFDKILAEGIVAHKRGIQSEYRPALNPNLLRMIYHVFRGSEIGGSIGFYGGNMLERRPKKKAIIKLASMEVGGDIGE